MSPTEIGSEFAHVAVRTFVDPADPTDVAAVNALQDQLALVSGSSRDYEHPDYDQDSLTTTRDLLHADTVIDGIPIRMSDTAGVRDAEESIEKEGVIRALAAVAQADLVVQVTEPGIEPADAAKWGVRLALWHDPVLTGRLFDRDIEFLEPISLKRKILNKVTGKKRVPLRLS